MDAPVPLTTTLPPLNDALPTNVPLETADQIPPWTYVPAAHEMFTTDPVLVPVEPAVHVVCTRAYPPPVASLVPVVPASAV